MRQTRLKEGVRDVVCRSPLTYQAMCLFKTVRGKLPTRATRLVVEGYPRSANTFAFYLARELLPGAEIAHHIHNIASIKLGLAHQTPMAILYRAPLDTVTSLAQKQAVRPDDVLTLNLLLKRWVAYYSFAQRKLNADELVSFETVVRTPQEFVMKLAKLAEVALSPEEASEISAVATRKLSDKERVKATFGSSLPQEERARSASTFEDTLKRCDLMPRALEVYEELLRGSQS